MRNLNSFKVRFMFYKTVIIILFIVEVIIDVFTKTLSVYNVVITVAMFMVPIIIFYEIIGLINGKQYFRVEKVDNNIKVSINQKSLVVKPNQIINIEILKRPRHRNIRISNGDDYIEWSLLRKSDVSIVVNELEKYNYVTKDDILGKKIVLKHEAGKL